MENIVEKRKLKNSKNMRINIRDKMTDEKVDVVHNKMASIRAKI